jgi:hypothetical protein
MTFFTYQRRIKRKEKNTSKPYFQEPFSLTDTLVFCMKKLKLKIKPCVYVCSPCYLPRSGVSTKNCTNQKVGYIRIRKKETIEWLSMRETSS